MSKYLTGPMKKNPRKIAYYEHLSKEQTMKKVRYLGRRPDGHMKYMNIPAALAVEKGFMFEDEGYEMHITESDKLLYLVYKHCPHLHIKFNPDHKYTISELFKLCPATTYDLVDYNGGEEFIADVLLGYEQLYNQEQIVKSWQENLQ